MYRYLLFLLCLLTYGCASEISGDESEPLQLFTDQRSYTASYLGKVGPYERFGFDVVTEYQNNTGDTIYLSRCFPDSETPIFGINTISGSESAYNQAYACVGHDNHFVLQPGESRTDTLRISGPNSSYGGVVLAEFEGLHRINFRAYNCRERDSSCLLPYNTLISNTFDVNKEKISEF